MKVIWEHNKQKDNISNFVSEVTWSGSVNQATRQLSISVINSPLDENITDINIKLGDRLLLYEKGYQLINAMVYQRERLSEQGTVTYEAFDDLKRLVKSNCTYNFKNTTPEKITNTLCNMLNIQTKDIAITRVPIKKLIVESEGFYTILMKAYTKAYQATGKKYMPLMVGNKLSVVEKGEIIDNFFLSDKLNITSSNYSESIENMINTVKIYNDKGKQVGQVKDNKNIDRFGVFQDAYTKEEGVNATVTARKMLTGVSKEASIDAIGNIQCIAGYGVQIKDSITDLVGKFWIDTDSHTWSNGIHTMSLNLTYKNLMDIQ